MGISDRTRSAVAAVAAAMMLTGCGHTIAGTAVPATRRAPAPTTAQMSESVNAFWRSQGTDPHYIMTPVVKVACAGQVSREQSLFCRETGQLLYNPAALAQLRRDGGDWAVELTLARDVGNAVQDAAGRWTAYPDEMARERSADCASGAYMRHAHPGAVEPIQHAVSFTWINTDVSRLAAFLNGWRGEVAPLACLDYIGA
jgi:hypothetical protein